jgi:hypothetical protein
VIVSNQPYFYKKAELFPGSAFIIGADTAARLVNVRSLAQDKLPVPHYHLIYLLPEGIVIVHNGLFFYVLINNATQCRSLQFLSSFCFLLSIVLILSAICHNFYNWVFCCPY